MAEAGRPREAAKPTSRPACPSAVLARLPYARLRFELTAEEPAVLPAFKGSLLRGAFGHALRRKVCEAALEDPCESCSLRRVCAYGRLYEARVEGTPPPFLRGVGTPARPYVFEPGSERRRFAGGDGFEFDLLLLGSAAELQAPAVRAVAAMARAGLGEGRRRFTLTAARYLAADGRLRAGAPPAAGQGSWPAQLPALVPPPLDLSAGRARLRFLTPMRFASHGRPRREIDFPGLVVRALRRGLELAHFYLPGAEVCWDWADLLERARAVEVRAQRLAWQDLERSSSRQGARLPLGGLMGSMDLEGDLEPFAALLAAARVFHVGKGAVFGLGRLEVEPGVGSAPPP